MQIRNSCSTIHTAAMELKEETLMSMIKTDKLIYEYEKLDDEGNVIGTHRAIDEVNLDIEPGQFIAILGVTMVPENLRWQSK